MREVRLDKYKSTIHIGASRLKQLLWYATNVIFFKSSIPFPSLLKKFLLQLYGAKVGIGVRIKPCINIKYPWKLQIGDYCWIGENVWIDNLENVIIGNHCCISQGAMLLTGSHNAMKATFDYDALPIQIENGVWIGAKAIVAPGVICKTHSILSVGSVAEKDLQPFTINKGNPSLPILLRTII